MFLALKEIRRGAGRFALLTAALGLLVFLILFQQALQAALLRSFVGAIENQTAPVIVFSVDGQRTIQGSVITPDLEEMVAGVEGVEAVGRFSAGEFTVEAGGELRDATIVGYQDPELGAPSRVVEGRLPSADGEVVASAVDASFGFDVGDVVSVVPGGLELEVVGLAEDAQLNVSATLFTTTASYDAAASARNPDAGAPLPNALAVSPAEGISPAEISERINDADPRFDALPSAEAADASPAVASVTQSFQIIFALFGVVVPCVTGLFFLIITFQKAGALTLLRAVGAPAGRLVRSILFQVGLISAAGYAVGVLMFLPLVGATVGSLPLRFDPGTVITWLLVIVVLSLLSALFSIRRVLRIDPASAAVGQGVGS